MEGCTRSRMESGRCFRRPCTRHFGESSPDCIRHRTEAGLHPHTRYTVRSEASNRLCTRNHKESRPHRHNSDTIRPPRPSQACSRCRREAENRRHTRRRVRGGSRVPDRSPSPHRAACLLNRKRGMCHICKNSAGRSRSRDDNRRCIARWPGRHPEDSRKSPPLCRMRSSGETAYRRRRRRTSPAYPASWANKPYRPRSISAPAFPDHRSTLGPDCRSLRRMCSW